MGKEESETGKEVGKVQMPDATMGIQLIRAVLVCKDKDWHLALA